MHPVNNNAVLNRTTGNTLFHIMASSILIYSILLMGAFTHYLDTVAERGIPAP